MSRALEMGKSSATGSFHLLIGVVGSTVIMAIGTLVIQGLLSVDEVGLYGMAMIPAAIISYFRDWGINSALTKEVANLRVSGTKEQIHDVMKSGVVFELISGIVLSVIAFVAAYPLALIISPENAPELSIYIAIMSLSIFAGAIASAASGIFIGFERMKLNSFVQVLQAIVKTLLGPLLIVLGFGLLGAVSAAMLSILTGGIISLVLVYYVLFRPLHKCRNGKCDIKTTLRPMLRFGLPLTVSTIVVGVLPQVISFTMAIYAGTWMMGNYFSAVNFAVLLTFVSTPVATALFPVFSKLNPETESDLTKTVFASSVKYTALLLVPAAFMLMALSVPLVNTLFPKDGIFQTFFVVNAEPKFPYAPLFLSLSALVYLFVLVGNISLGTFQSGIGKTGQIMKQSFLSLALGLPFAYFMVVYFYDVGGPSYAVIGGIIGSLIASMPGMIWGLIWSWKNYRVKADFVVSGKIALTSIIAAVAAYLLISLLSLPWWVLLGTGFLVFVLVYLSIAPLIGAVNRMDIENFQVMFSGLGIVSKVLSLPLRYMGRLCRKGSNANNVLTLGEETL
ncbi:MAG: oligosaccharide flippase family protein [Crenarchaeota archaeon]|jgi:O-antigen/teichoic acid export membrane protein|nr:oligosaccharide flippase family protein [Thermoproteota archaeon]